MIIETAKKFNLLLAKNNKKEAIFLMLLMFLVAIVDAIGIASIMPLLMVITDPMAIENSTVVELIWSFLQKFIKFDESEFLIIFGAVTFAVLIFSLFSRALLTYWQLNFSSRMEYKITTWLMERQIHLPYEDSLERNTNEFAAKNLTEIATVIYQSLIPALIIFTHTCTVISMLIILILVSGKEAVFSGVMLICAYLVIILATKKKVGELGNDRLSYNQQRFSVFNQAIRGFRDIKLANTEKVYLKKYTLAAKPFAVNWALGQIIAQLPRFLIEALAFGGLLVFVIYSSLREVPLIEAFPNITLYALVAYRLLPSLQQIYSNLANLQFAYPSLLAVADDFEYFTRISHNAEASNEAPKLFNKISLVNVSYRYPSQVRFALANISLEVPMGETLGIVGETGSGKSSLIDIITSLLQPTEGKLMVDGSGVNECNSRDWQSRIGYVQQDIFIFDMSVAENIALGVAYDDIDFNRLEYVAEIADIKHFIENKLESGYATFLGEANVRLSGGEKQRIGIARALYKQPDLLILDEATSALDIITEQRVLGALKKVGENLTVIIIAHKIAAIKECDRVVLLSDGRIKKYGTFSDVASFFDHTAANSAR